MQNFNNSTKNQTETQTYSHKINKKNIQVI